MKEKNTASSTKKGGQPRTRMRREPPERNGPIRSRSIFNPAAGFGQSAAAGRPCSGSEPVDRAVNTAYRVCEENLRQGWEAAARHREYFATKEVPGPGPMPRYEKSDPYDDMRRRSEQLWSGMYHNMYNMLNLGLEMLAPFLPAGAPWPTQQHRGPGNDPRAAWPTESRATDCSYPGRAEPRPAAPSAEPRCVLLRLVSKLPVRVVVEVERLATNYVFPLKPMRGFEGSGQVKVDASGRVELQLAVPDGQRPGTYAQELWDNQHHTKVGTVKIIIDSGLVAACAD